MISGELTGTGGYGTSKDVFKSIDAKFSEITRRKFKNLGINLTDTKTTYTDLETIVYSSSAVSIIVDSIEYDIGTPDNIYHLAALCNDELDIGWFFVEGGVLTVLGFHVYSSIKQSGYEVFAVDVIAQRTNFPVYTDIYREIALKLKKLLNPPTVAWLLDGNTNGAEKSLGTTDAFDLPFIVYGSEKARILKSTGFFGIGTATPSSILEVKNASTTSTLPYTTSPGAGITLNNLTGSSRIISSYVTGANTNILDFIPDYTNYPTLGLRFVRYNVIGTSDGFFQSYTPSGGYTIFENTEGDGLFLTTFVTPPGTTNTPVMIGTQRVPYVYFYQSYMRLSPYGTSSGETYALRFRELVANGTDYVGFKAPDAVVRTTIWTLPDDDAPTSAALLSNAAGVLSWSYGLFCRTATPEASQTATRGAISLVNDGTYGEIYLKASGTGNTGWKRISGQGYSLAVCCANGSTVSSSSTVYGQPFFGNSFNATESNRQFTVKVAGYANKLYVRINSAQPASGSLVITLRVNGADTGLVVTIAASAVAGTYTELVTKVPLAVGDLVDYKIVNNASGTSANIMEIDCFVE